MNYINMTNELSLKSLPCSGMTPTPTPLSSTPTSSAVRGEFILFLKTILVMELNLELRGQGLCGFGLKHGMDYKCHEPRAFKQDSWE